MSVGTANAKDRSFALVNCLAHADIDKENETVEFVDHFTGLPFRAIGECCLSRLMSHDEMVDA
jgi:hypothetical protein